MFTFEKLRKWIQTRIIEENDFDSPIETLGHISLPACSVVQDLSKYRDDYGQARERLAENIISEEQFRSDVELLQGLVKDYLQHFSVSDLREDWQELGAVQFLNGEPLGSQAAEPDSDPVLVADDVEKEAGSGQSNNGNGSGEAAPEVLEVPVVKEAVAINEDHKRPSSSSKEEVDFEVLKKELITLTIIKDDFKTLFDIVTEISRPDCGIVNEIQSFYARRERLKRKEMAGLINAEESDIDFNRISNGALECLKGYVEQDLKDGWEESDSVHRLMGRSYDSEEEIKEDHHDEESKFHLEDIEALTNVKGKIPEEKLYKYKQMMYKAQDEIGAGEYRAAYRYSQQASDIYSNSRQVYQYLLLSFLRMESAEVIVEKALRDDLKLFKRLNAYADKLKKLAKIRNPRKKQLRHQEEGKPQKTTKANNKIYFNTIQEVVSSLLYQLRNKYHRLITDLSIPERQLRQQIRAMFNLAEKIYDISPSTIFVRNLKLELIGGKYLKWAKVEINGRIKNRSSLDVEKYWAMLDGVVADTAANHKPDINNNITDYLQSKFETKYGRINFNFRDKIERKNEKQADIAHLIEDVILAFKLTDNADFLKIPIKELEGDGEFRWVELNENGELVPHYSCKKIFKRAEYKPLEKLAFLWSCQNKNVEEQLQRLKIEICKKDLELSDEIYEKELERKLKSGKHDPFTDSSDRNKILRCLQSWRVHYILMKDESSLEKSIKELSGQGIFAWFDFDDNGGIIELSFSHKFDMARHLRYLLETNGEEPDTALNAFICDSIFYNIRKKYDQLPDRGSHGQESSLPVLIGLLTKARKCYNAMKKEVYNDFILEELAGRKKFKWFEQVYLMNYHVNLVHNESAKLGFDALSEMAAAKNEKQLNQ